jgi:hypothetical protein
MSASITNAAAIRAFRGVFGTLTLFAVGRQLVLHAQLGYDVVNFFSFFTNLSNLFAGCLFLMGIRGVAAPGFAKLFDVLRLMAATNMVVVGIVFSVLLRGADLGSLLPWVNWIVHYLMPIVVILDWIVAPPRHALGRRELLITLVVPLLYLAYVLIRGNFVGWYPYPFLNPANVGGYGGVAVYAVGVAAVFLIGGWGLIASATLRRGRLPHRVTLLS